MKLLTLITLILICSCQKELSKEKKCGVVVRKEFAGVYVKFDDGGIEWVPGNYSVNSKYCK